MSSAREAAAATHPCVLHAYHKPMPLVTQGHHVFPLELQKTVWPTVNRDVPASIHDPETIWVCGTGHDTIHALIRGVSQAGGHRAEAKWAVVALRRLEIAKANP